MSSSPRGRVVPLSIARRLVEETLHHARKIPSLPLARDCRIEPLVEARENAKTKYSWYTLFMKAYGIVSQRYPELRRAYIRWPYPRLYEHPRSEAGILVEREYEGEQVVLGAKLISPETTPLGLIQDHLRRFQEDDLHSISPFRQLIRLGKFPKFLRRFLFWTALNWSGYRRARRFGTFVMSSLGNYGVEQFHPLAPTTTYFTFGPIQPSGEVTLKIIYDHRVLDGRTVARALVDLEKILNHEIVAELQSSLAVAA